MRVFLTGATGFIGTAVVPELISAGHEVLGMTRSDSGAQALAAAGAVPHRGSLEDLESLRRGTEHADAVIHCAFDHDFTDFAAVCAKDKHAIETLGKALAGSNRVFIATGGLAIPDGNRELTEDSDLPTYPHMPRVSEPTALSFVAQGVSAGVMRLSQIHDTKKQGLITYMIGVAREKGVSAYVGEGQQSFAAAHLKDVARLYRLAVEHHQPGARYHAVTEEHVSMRSIAEALGEALNIPVQSIPEDQAVSHFGPFLGAFVSRGITGSGKLTRERLGWNPTGPTLLADLRALELAAA